MDTWPQLLGVTSPITPASAGGRLQPNSTAPAPLPAAAAALAGVGDEEGRQGFARRVESAAVAATTTAAAAIPSVESPSRPSPPHRNPHATLITLTTRGSFRASRKMYLHRWWDDQTDAQFPLEGDVEGSPIDGYVNLANMQPAASYREEMALPDSNCPAIPPAKKVNILGPYVIILWSAFAQIEAAHFAPSAEQMYRQAAVKGVRFSSCDAVGAVFNVCNKHWIALWIDLWSRVAWQFDSPAGYTANLMEAIGKPIEHPLQCFTKTMDVMLGVEANLARTRSAWSFFTPLMPQQKCWSSAYGVHALSTLGVLTFKDHLPAPGVQALGGRGEFLHPNAQAAAREYFRELLCPKAYKNHITSCNTGFSAWWQLYAVQEAKRALEISPLGEGVQRCSGQQGPQQGTADGVDAGSLQKHEINHAPCNVKKAEEERQQRLLQKQQKVMLNFFKPSASCAKE